jgi:hypothetical protein
MGCTCFKNEKQKQRRDRVANIDELSTPLVTSITLSIEQLWLQPVLLLDEGSKMAIAYTQLILPITHYDTLPHLEVI